MNAIVDTVRIDYKDFIKLSPQVKFLLVIQLSILFILSILIGIILSPKFKNQVSKQAVIPVTDQIQPTLTDTEPKNILAIVPEKLQMGINESQTVQVIYQGDPTSAVDLALNIDSSVFNVSDIIENDRFDTLLRREVIDNKLYFSAARSPYADNEITDDDSIHIMTFTITALRPAQSTRISFDRSNTIVAASGKDILQGVESIIISIDQAYESPEQ